LNRFYYFKKKKRTVPIYFIWAQYISWFSYSNEILIINQWSNVQNITHNPNSTSDFRTGSDVIHFLKMDEVK